MNVLALQNDPDSGMDRDDAHLFGAMLEAVGAGVLAFALGIATVVEVRIVRTITRPPVDNQHEDYKIRTEALRLEDMKKAAEEQEVILAMLTEAHDLKKKEQEDVRAMRHHETAEAKFENPLLKAHDATKEEELEQEEEANHTARLELGQE
jgi:hypothetical protein